MSGLSLRRGRSLYEVWNLDLTLRRLRREEEQALARAGEALRGHGAALATSSDPILAEAARKVAEVERRDEELAVRLRDSLVADRRDYQATTSGIGRAWVVLRGTIDRVMLRDEAWRARKELPALRATLARRAMGELGHAGLVPEAERSEVQRLHRALEVAVEARARLVAACGGEPVPRWLARIASELRTLGTFVWDELTRKFVLRLPALVSVAVAWGLTRRYAESGLESRLNRILYGDEGISRETLDALRFWLPLLAAALTAYLSTTIARRVRRRYGSEGG